MRTAILLLAAGPSSRMGQSKQLLEINGEPILVRAVKAAMAASNPVCVVLGAQFEKHKHALDHFSVMLIENKKWKKGMGSSLKLGLEFLIRSNPEIDSVIVLVCDQPRLSATYLQELIARADKTEKSIIASSYNGVVGVPVLFKKQQFEMLKNLDDAAGAGKIIRQQSELIEIVNFPGGHIDLDTPEEYAAYLAESGRSQRTE